MKFYINVWELMIKLLPRPTPKPISERAETLKEIPIIKEGYRAC